MMNRLLTQKKIVYILQTQPIVQEDQNDRLQQTWHIDICIRIRAKKKSDEFELRSFSR